MATLVVDLCDRRPIWSLPSWAKEQIRGAAPAHWSVAFMETEADGSGDGTLRAAPELIEAVADARVYMGYGIPTEVLEAGERLEWVHSGAAGVASSLGPAMLARDVLFTNSAGVHGPPMAETVLAMLLYFARGLDVAIRAQRDGRWSAPAYWAADAPVGELRGSTVGIVGFGGIGREVARLAACMGSRVLALRRRDGQAPGRTASAGSGPVGPSDGSGRECPPVETFCGEEGLARILRESDYLVLAVPETDETRALIGRKRLFEMKPGAVLVNVSRGGVLDEEGVLAALDEGPLRGAGLDVFATEPLPAGHPFYAHPKVLATPHVSATTRRFWEREARLIVDNLTRFAQGKPLRNLVDKEAGY